MNTIKEKVGERIKQIRYLQNISQEDLANSAQMSRGFISGVETGKRNITVETPGKILEVLHKNYAEFFDDKMFK